MTDLFMVTGGAAMDLNEVIILAAIDLWGIFTKGVAPDVPGDFARFAMGFIPMVLTSLEK